MDETTRYLRPACLAWLKFRVVYNLVLLTEALLCSWRPLERFAYSRDCRLIVIWLFGTANAFYSLGPLIETYTCVFLGRRVGRARYWLLAAILLLSMGFLFRQT